MMIIFIAESLLSLAPIGSTCPSEFRAPDVERIAELSMEKLLKEHFAFSFRIQTPPPVFYETYIIFDRVTGEGIVALVCEAATRLQKW